ncbi:MAG: hypothetical protein AAGJ35_14415, partial [Myxococcota bacterium]
MSSHAPRTLTESQITLPAKHPWRPWAPLLMYIGLGGLLLGALTLFLFDHHTRAIYYGAYLVSFLFFLSIVMGSMFFVLIHHATRAGWSTAVRRLAEFLMGTLFIRLKKIPVPLMFLLFLP